MSAKKNFRGGNLDKSPAWHMRNCEPAKVGTQPWLIIRDRRTKLRVGATIKFRKPEPWSQWHTGIVTDIDPLFISFA